MGQSPMGCSLTIFVVSAVALILITLSRSVRERMRYAEKVLLPRMRRLRIARKVIHMMKGIPILDLRKGEGDAGFALGHT